MVRQGGGGGSGGENRVPGADYQTALGFCNAISHVRKGSRDQGTSLRPMGGERPEFRRHSGSPEGRGPEAMNTGLWNMASGLAPARRPGMTDQEVSGAITDAATAIPASVLPEPSTSMTSKLPSKAKETASAAPKGRAA